MTLSAVDISRWNHPEPWGLMKASKVALVIAKCTEHYPDGTTYVDPDYEANRRGAAAIGARFGAYAYGHPNASAARSWEAFAATARLHAGDIALLDLEESDGLAPHEVAGWGSAYVHAAFGATKAWPWAYSDQNFIELGNLDGCKPCPLWVAVLSARPNPVPVHFPGFNTIAEQYKWGGAGVPNWDVIYLNAAPQLARYAIPADPGSLTLERERQLLADLAAAQRNLASIARMSGLLGLGKARTRARQALNEQTINATTGPDATYSYSMAGAR